MLEMTVHSTNTPRIDGRCWPVVVLVLVVLLLATVHAPQKPRAVVLMRLSIRCDTDALGKRLAI